MYEIGSHIIYGLNGICRVAEIGPSPYDKEDTRLYYRLVPVHAPQGSLIYTPVENASVPMRPLLSAAEIEALFARVGEVEPLTVSEERSRRDLYRSRLNELDPDGYVSVIKTINIRREALVAAHKHVPVTDLEYGRLARHLLFGECAYVLGKTEEEIAAELPL